MYFNHLFIEDLIEFSAQLGVSPSIFREYQKSNQSRQDDKVDYDSVVSILKIAIDKSRNDCFGLHLGEYFQLKATKSVDTIMEKSLTIKEAFSNAVHYSKLISDAMDCELVETDGYFKVIFRNNPDWEIRSELAKKHILDTSLVSALKSIQCLSGFQYYPRAIKFPYSRPKHLNEYFRIFNCSVTFNQAYAEIQFDRGLLKKSIKSSDFGLLEKLKSNAEVQLKELNESDDLILEIKRSILEGIKNNAFPGIKDIATTQNTTVRTLQRRLREKQLLYSEILSEVKLNLALRHLKDDYLKIEEIAYLLGYSETSAFTRAFKKWKGTTPKSFQQKYELKCIDEISISQEGSIL